MILRFWKFLKEEKPFPWGIKRVIDLDKWQVMYMEYAKSVEADLDFKKNKLMLDYMGTYFDPKRAVQELKNSDEKDSEKTIYKNIGYEKDKPPKVILNEEEQKEFDKQMKAAFGGLNDLMDEKDVYEDDEFDDIVIKGDENAS